MNRVGNKPKAIGLASCSAVAILAASCPAKAAEMCNATPPVQVIKIFNDSDVWIFPELEPGLNTVADQWMQAFCKVPNSKIGTDVYRNTLTWRFYINPETGIAPGASVVVTIPVYTQLVATANLDPTKPNQYAEWWQGENMQVFSSSTSTPPRAFVEDYQSISRKGQKSLISNATNPTFPACAGNAAKQPCKLVFFSDTDGTLPKNGPSQLIEATLGSERFPPVVNDSPPYLVNPNYADFDVSYVNVAYMPAAMGPYKNNQVGYVGSPMQPEFTPVLNAPFFRTILDEFKNNFSWPRFVVTYADLQQCLLLMN